MVALRASARDNMSLNTRNFRCLLLVPALLAVGGCSDVSWPWSRHRDTATVAPVAPGSNGGSDKGSDNAADCAQLQTEIRDNEERRRNATTESTSPEIVAAAEAKAGQQIDALRARFDALDCPGEADPRYRRAPVTPAPGALPP
jgi:hypothetical protein